MKTAIVAAGGAALKSLQTLVEQTCRATPAATAWVLPIPFPVAPLSLRPLLVQAPEVVLLDLPTTETGIEAGMAAIEWLREQMPPCALMVIGPLEPPHLIVRAMRAGANEYLERPLPAAALAEALARAVRTRYPAVPGASPRGLLMAVLGARGGCGATTVAVNLAVALQQSQPDGAPVVLLDAAPLGHAALHLNLKPQFTLLDLLGQASRLDAALLRGLMIPHRSGLSLLAGVRQPLPAALAEGGAPAVCLELLLHTFPLVVVDLSARLDELTRAVIAHADRVLFVAQPDVVSLWSAATVRQYLDAAARLRFELVLNHCDKARALDVAGLEELTRTPLRWRLPYDRAAALAAVERGEPVVLRQNTELADSFRALSQTILGRAEKKKSRGWLPFFRVREVEG